MLQEQIPSGLQALIQASQVLQQQSNPTVQTPEGPKPTVAGMVSQNLQQMAQQQMPQQPQQMPPNMQQMGQQAGIAGQIMAQQQAQQQQQAQNPQAIAQMAAQMMQQQQAPGIEGIPVNMQFNEGGIVGFAGDEGSYVPSISPEFGVEFEGDPEREYERSKIIEELIGRGMATARRAAPVLVGGSEVLERSMANAALAGRQALSEALQQSRGGKSIEEYYGEPFRPKKEEKKEEKTAPLPGETFPARESTMPLRETPAEPSAPKPLTQIPNTPEWQQFLADVQQADLPLQDKMAVVQDAMRQGIMTPKWTGSKAEVTRPGVADGTMPKPVTMQDVLTGAKTLAPDTEIKEQITRLRKINEEREKAIAGMTDLDAQGIAAIQKASAERERLRAAKAQDDNINRTLAFFRDLGTKGTAFESFYKSVQDREEANRVASLNEEQAIIKLQAAQQARALGKFERAEALEKEVLGHAEKARTAQIQAAQIAANVGTNTYQQQMQYLTEQLRQSDQAANRAESKRVREQGNDETLLRQYDTAIAAAVEKAQKVVESRFPLGKMYEVDPASRTKNPEEYQRYLQEKQKVFDQMVAPLEQDRLRVLNRVRQRAGEPPMTAPSTTQTSGPTEGQEATSASGRAMVYRNGRWEYK